MTPQPAIVENRSDQTRERVNDMTLGMIVNHNLGSMNALAALDQNGMALQSVLQQLSTGKRINSAADDAAGLAISQKMQSQINGLSQASQNAQDGISLIQTAEGALNETQSILQRMNQLSVQAANDSSTNSDRSQLQKEFSQLKSEVDRIASTTQFNSKNLLDGSLSAAKAAQGTIENSSVIQAAATAATSGNETGGVGAAMQSAVAAVNGTGQSISGSGVLASSINITSGVNDKFNFTVNGTTETATIGASPAGGYTRTQFVQAVQTAINSVLATNSKNSPGAQVTASLTSSNQLQLTSTETGSGTAVSVAAPAAGSGDALAAMGFEGTASSLTATGAVNLGVWPGNTAAGNLSFKLDLNGNTQTISLTAGDANTTTLISDMQSKLDTAFGTGVVTAGLNASNQLTLTSSVSGINNMAVSANAADTFYTNFINTAGGVTTGAAVAANGNTTTNGTDTIHSVSAGTVISQGVNDQFKLAVDGQAAQTVTLNAGTYATTQSLVNELNNEIGSNSSLNGKVSASVNTAGKVVFTSASTGTTSGVTVSAPSTAAESALGALGYAGAAGALQGATGTQVSIKAGVSLAATDEKFTVTLGNSTATIDLSKYTQVASDVTAGVKSSRDTIVQAFQSQLDAAFGAGAVTASTTTSGSNEYLVLSPSAQASGFSIANAATTNTGMNKLIDSAATYTGTTTALAATVGSAPTDVNVAGTNAQTNALANATLLTSLTDVNGNNLGLTAGNVINVSGTQNGQGFTTSVNVTATSTVGDVLSAMRGLNAFSGGSVSLDTTNGDVLVQGSNGATHDISNLKFAAQNSSTDTTAVASFNRVFGSFNVTQQAQDASLNNSLNMQIGANQGQVMNIDINNMGSSALKVGSLDVSTQAGAQNAIAVVNNAIDQVSGERAKLGAFQNRLSHTINNLSTSNQNLTTAQAGITDLNMAAAMAQFTKDNVLQQAATAMLAQANQQPQLVLKLLG